MGRTMAAAQGFIQRKNDRHGLSLTMSASLQALLGWNAAHQPVLAPVRGR